MSEVMISVEVENVEPPKRGRGRPRKGEEIRPPKVWTEEMIMEKLQKREPVLKKPIEERVDHDEYLRSLREKTRQKYYEKLGREVPPECNAKGRGRPRKYDTMEEMLMGRKKSGRDCYYKEKLRLLKLENKAVA